MYKSTSESAQSSKDLRVQRTYYMLQNAFTELLEEKTYEAITINDLCDRAFIRRTTFYRHFTDKDDYFRFYITQLQEEFQKDYTHSTTEISLGAYFLSMCQELFHFMEKHKRIIQVMAKSEGPSYYQVYSLLISQIQENLFNFIQRTKCPTPSNLAPDLLIAYYSSALLGALRYWFQHAEANADASEFINAIKVLMAEPIL